MQYSEDTNILVVCHNGILRSIKGNYFENYQDLNSSNLETVTINNENYKYYNNIKTLTK